MEQAGGCPSLSHLGIGGTSRKTTIWGSEYVKLYKDNDILQRILGADPEPFDPLFQVSPQTFHVVCMNRWVAWVCKVFSIINS